jgi:hypothetical protein
MLKNAGRGTITFLLAALAAPAAPARAEGVETSTPVAQTGQSALSGANFYRQLDRPDLAERYERRLGWKYVGGAAGVAIMGAGIVWGALDLFNTSWQNEFRCCGASMPIGGAHASPYPWLTAGAGLGVLVAAVTIPAHPLGDEQRLELARAHRLTLTPRLGAGSAELMVAGRF